MNTPQLLLEQARDYARAENERANSLQIRTTAIVAAAGVILSLSITVGKDLFTHQVDKSLFHLLFVATLALLFISALLGVSVLWPPASYAASVEEVEDYLSDSTLDEGERETATALISSLHFELAETRASNDKKSRLLGLALVMLVIGALGASVLGATLGLTDRKLPSPNPGALKSK